MEKWIIKLIFGDIILPKTEKQVVPAKDGLTIQLTIDKTIQNFVEDAMNQVDEKYSPKKMLVVVTNPKTGEIYAMSQRPSFHPSTREGLTENWLNDAVENTIEPGSTMKIFTLPQQLRKTSGIRQLNFNRGNIRSTIGLSEMSIGPVGEELLSSKVSKGHQTSRWLTYWKGWVTGEFIEYLHDFGFGEKSWHRLAE